MYAYWTWSLDVGILQNLSQNYKSLPKSKKREKEKRKTKKFNDNLRLLLSVITSFSQDGCLIFLVFLTNCKIIIIFHKFRPKKAFTSSYEAAEPYFRLVSQVIKSFCDSPKTWRNSRNWRRYDVAMASCGINIVHYIEYNLGESISSCWLSLNKIYGTKQ